MKIKTRMQLSTLMFLQYFIWGAWYVTLNTFLGESLNFTGTQIGLCYGTFAIAAMVSPFFVGLVADKFFSTEKVLGTMHILGGIMLVITAQAKTFGLFYPSLLIYTMTYTPTMALSNSLSFHQMKDPGKEFPGIRVLGTIGWIVANNVIGFMHYGSSVNQLYVAAVASIMLGFYSFSLPHTPPKKEFTGGIKEILGLDALSLLKDRAFSLIIIASILTCIPLSFYFGFTASFMSDLDMKYIANKISMGQMSEIIFMLILPFFLRKYGVKKVFIVGMSAWLLRYLLFSFGDADALVWMIYLGIILHGICYDFFFVTGQIYVDNKAPKHLRSSAQGMITFATYGFGMFIGTWFSGKVVDYYSVVDGDKILHQWDKIWLIPALIAAVVLILFVFIFKEKNKSESLVSEK